jgi:hypothetical protein
MAYNEIASSADCAPYSAGYVVVIAGEPISLMRRGSTDHAGWLCFEHRILFIGHAVAFFLKVLPAAGIAAAVEPQPIWAFFRLVDYELVDWFQFLAVSAAFSSLLVLFEAGFKEPGPLGCSAIHWLYWHFFEQNFCQAVLGRNSAWHLWHWGICGMEILLVSLRAF